MKKMMKAAAVLAAMVMALSLSACSNNDDDEPSDGDGVIATLPKASGRDPFKNGYYSPKSRRDGWSFFGSIVKDEKGKYYDGLICADLSDFIKFDTSTRTLELLNHDKMVHDNGVQFKYTYNEADKTVTLVLSKRAIPTDPSKYIEYAINENYTDDYYRNNISFRLGSLSEFKKALVTVYANEAYRKWWTSEGNSLAELDAQIKQIESEHEEAFATLLVYTYTVNADGSIKLDLTSPTPIDDEQSTTLQFVGN